MSASSESELDLDLELHFLPAWAQKPADQNQYAQYTGRPERPEGGREFRDRPPRRRDQGQTGRGPSPRSGRPAEGRTQGRQRGESGRGEGRPREQRGERERERPAPVALPEINCAYVPDDRGVESLARQIKITGRAYPLFEIAQMVLQKPERHSVTLSVIKKGEGQVAQPLFQCALDETIWLSEEEAVQHVLTKHFATFYQAEKIQTDPPKGTYTFVAQCGMSGVILGPPNYHDYQNQLRKLHSERFSRMPFDAFKARVRIVKDEAVVKKWVEEQSWKTEYVCLNVPEALTLPTREEVEKHFHQVHASNIIKQVETAHLSGSASRGIRSAPLARLIRQTWEDQKRFPLQVATALSQKFASHGLQFFKVNKTVTHVAVARPHFLDVDAAPVSDGIRKIVQFINEHPKCTRRKLVDALAPGSQPVQAPAADGTPAQPAEPTPEYTALVSDLHWLIHQGHVIEFATGVLEAAKKPIIRPQKPAPAKPAETDSAAPSAEPKTDGVVEGGVVEEAVQSPPVGEAHDSTVADAPSAEVPADAGVMTEQTTDASKVS